MEVTLSDHHVTTGVPLLSLPDAYIARLTLAGYRPRTIKARRDTLHAFARWLEPMTLHQATRSHVEAWLARPLAPESRRAYRSALRSFYRWAVDEGHLAADPTERVPPIRVPRALPRPVSETDLSAALTRADQRMTAWLLLMALAGLRCVEVSALLPRDLIRQDTGWLLFLRETKGGGQATVPAHPALVESLARLPQQGGTWWTARPAYVSRQVSVHLRASGVDATAHQLRHFAGTSWFRSSGHDLLTTATLLRHQSVATTQVYAHLDPVRPAAVVLATPAPAL